MRATVKEYQIKKFEHEEREFRYDQKTVAMLAILTWQKLYPTSQPSKGHVYFAINVSCFEKKINRFIRTSQSADLMKMVQ